MNRPVLLLIWAGLALLGLVGLRAQDAPVQPQPQPSVGQNRGVVAGNVGNVTINNFNSRPRDPQRQGLEAVMVMFSLQMHEILGPFRSGNVYLALYDTRDPVFAGRPEMTYYFVVMPLESVNVFSDETDRCMFQEGFALLGFAVAVRSGDQVNIEADTVSLDDPLFQALCDSIGADARTSWSTESGSNGPGISPLTNYDVISRGARGVLVLEFFPSNRDGLPFEQQAAREYWGAAFQERDLTRPAEWTRRIVEREVGEVAAAAIFAETAETGRLAFSMDPASFARGRSFDRIATAARSYFGHWFGEMDSAWVREIQSASVIVNSRPRRLMNQGSFMEVVERFRVADIGSARFWRHLSDGGEFVQSLNCIATIFAVDQLYAASADLQAYAACQIAQQGNRNRTLSDR